ncbi:MAG: hypothetical protein CME68_12120 [Halobacteriovoraceae bacterium]|nr:hypothetical protein [Halobacteriovoraceae bacterium]
MKLLKVPEYKKEYDNRINEIMVERAKAVTLYIFISCIFFHFHAMYNLLELSFSWPPYLFLFFSFLPYFLNKAGFSFFIKYPFYDIFCKFVFVYIFTDLLLSTAQTSSLSKTYIINLIKLTPFMVTSAIFPLKKWEISVMSTAQILLYFLITETTVPYHSDIFFVITFIFILFVMVFLINSHFNHKQILKDCIKTIEKEKLYNKLTKSEKKFRKLFESKALASCMANHNGLILQISETWSDIFEENLLGKGCHISNLFDNTSPNIKLSKIISNETLQLGKGTNFIPSKLLKTKTNKYFTIYCYYDIELEIIFINCKESTKEHLNSIRLVQQEKFAHLGKSSSGLAHDIFNPLSSLTLNLELSLENIEKTQEKGEANKNLIHDQNLIETRELVFKSLESAEAIKMIVTRFKSFSQIFSSSSLRNDLHEIVQTAIDLFSLPLSDKIEFKVSGISNNQYFIKDEKNNFFQVFLNFFQNSYTSYLQKNSQNKVIEIKVEEKSKTMLTIKVEDFANGIGEDHLKNVFDISFSTKDPQKFGGMGLFLSKDAVESSKGSIEIQSVLEEGTLITINLPYFISK